MTSSSPLFKSLLVVFGLLLSLASYAIEVVRGPYLQRATPSEITVKWRTDNRSDSVVRYGSSPNNLSEQAVVSASTRDHRVVIRGLSPDTTYYYSVGRGSGAIVGGNSQYRFQTSPVAGTETKTRIWVVGDAGTANSNQRAVYNAYLNYPGQENTDLWLMLGDNAYDDGTDSEYQRAVFNVYGDMLRRSTLWSTLGNHDGRSADSGNLSGPYYDIFSFPRNGEAGGVPSGTEAYYSFDYGNIHFVNLDSYDSNRSSNGAMLTWLRNDLANTSQKWIVAFFHHPPYSKGSHDTDNSSEYRSFEMRERALPILEQYGVDLVLSGHSHSYERSYLIDGHYGRSNTFSSQYQIDDGSGNTNTDGAYRKEPFTGNAGTIYSVAGASGKISGVGRHAAMYMAINELGSVVIDVEGDRLDMKYLNSNGQIRDDFTILKDGSNDGGNGDGSSGGDALTDTNHLAPGQGLSPGESLYSANGNYRLVLQSDGNFVMYDAQNNPIWASGTNGSGADRFVYQDDGNLVLYSGSQAVWSSKTNGNSSGRLVLNDNGSLVLYNGNSVVWSAGNNPPSGGGEGGNSGGNIRHIGSTSDYDAADKINISVPSGAQAGDLLTLFLSRTDDLLPIRLSGWTAGASCFKTNNGQSECHEIPDCTEQDGDYCLRFDGGRGRDLATVVFYKTLGANESRNYSFNLRGSKPSWAILSAVRGANNANPIGDVATESNDGSNDSRFPSVRGNSGDLLLLSMAFDDTTDRNDFGAPTGMEMYQWIAGSDEAGYVYGEKLTQSGETGTRTTRGEGGPGAKDALISLIVRAGEDNSGGDGTVTIEKRIVSGSDDVEERADGSMYGNSSDIELVNDNGNQTVGLRFTELAIPQGAVIESAYVQFTTDEANSGSTSLTVSGEDVNDAASFGASSRNVSSRVKTSAQVQWQPAGWSTAGQSGNSQRTPNLKNIVQEVIGRAGWKSGNDLVMIINGTGERTAESYEGSSSNAALLIVEYREATDVVDTTPPVIRLNGLPTLEVEQGQSFNDPGATATDDVDGDITNSIQVLGTVNTQQIGRYTLIYRVSDSSDNEAVPVSREVNVIQPDNGEMLVEAEARTTQNGTRIATNHSGYTGDGFIDFGGNGTWVEWSNIDVSKAGIYELTFRYANADNANRRAGLTVNGESAGNVMFSPTGSWTNWRTESIVVDFQVGSNRMRLTANTGEGGPNLDSVSIRFVSGTVSEVDEVSARDGYLVGGSGSSKPGFALYFFDNDLGNAGSVCNGGCATAWPPVLVNDSSASGGLGLSTITRDDGTQQATFNGRPLYFYAQDTAVNHTRGDGVNGVWWLAKIATDNNDLPSKTTNQFSAPSAALYALNDSRPRSFPKVTDTGFGGNGHAETWDGRIFVRTVSAGWVANAFRPERIVKNNDGSIDFRQGAFGRSKTLETKSEASDMQHNWLAIIPDPAVNGENPYPSNATGGYRENGSYQTYKAVVYHTSKRNGDNDQMGYRQATFVVSNALTENAEVTVADFTSSFQKFRLQNGADFRCIEPSVTIDGRLVICQGHPNNDGRIDNLVYSWNSVPATIDNWTSPKSIANMYFDDRDIDVAGVPFSVRFPIAERPLLDATGNDYNRGELVKGAYPWVSHDGAELFYQASREGVNARRTGTSVVGRWTGWTVRHIDGTINRNRYETDEFVTSGRRLFVSSPGAFTTMWSPYKDVDDLKIPYSVRGPSYPIFGSNSQDYSEVHFDDYLDGNYVLYLGMNEQLNRGGSFQVTKTNDTSGNFNNGTLVGAQFPKEYNNRDEIVGAHGQAIYFRSGNYIDIDKTRGWDSLKNGATVDLFVRKVNGSDTVKLFTLRNGIELFLRNGNAVSGIVHDTNGNQVRVDGTTISNNQWVHIALTFDAKEARITLFVDGNPVASNTLGNFGELRTDGSLRVGPENSSALLLLDEVKVSNVARAQYEVQYNAFVNSHKSPNAELANLIPSHLASLRFNATGVDRFKGDAVELGETLFNDLILSKNRTTSCATCHNSDQSFTDGLAIAKGNEPTDDGERNSQMLLNRLFSSMQTWDGKAISLDTQAIKPIEAKHEMNLPVSEAVQRLREDANYNSWFQQVYGEQPNVTNLSLALASFQATQFTPRNRVDDFLAGNRTALTTNERRGMALFEGKARCSGCHAGVNYTDESFRQNGLVNNGDRGRARITGRDRDHRLFKVPSLRQIADTAPYMHDGSFATLREVVERYNDGAVNVAMADTDMRPLELTNQEQSELVAFLTALSSTSDGSGDDGNGDDSGGNDDPETNENTLQRNERLNLGERIQSSNGNFRLTLQNDGNLVLRDQDGNSLWSSRTNGTDATMVVMQGDGNLVIYGSSAHWASNTHGTSATRVTLHNDGRLVIYNNDTQIMALN